MRNYNLRSTLYAGATILDVSSATGSYPETGFEEVSQIGTAKSARLETKSWMLGRLPVRISVRPLLDDRFGAVHAN